MEVIAWNRMYSDAAMKNSSGTSGTSALRFSEPLHITVEAPVPIPVPTTAQKDEGRTVPLWLFLAALLLQGVLLRSRLHKLEEERL